jgi:predicted nucleotidyltransferase
MPYSGEVLQIGQNQELTSTNLQLLHFHRKFHKNKKNCIKIVFLWYNNEKVNDFYEGENNMKFTYQGAEYELILITLAGSRFYGTHYDAADPERQHPFIPNYTSDRDLRGIFSASPDTKLGLIGTIEEIEIKKDGNGKVSPEHIALIDELNAKLGLNMKHDEDIILYEIKKFITLAIESNPNILDTLCADDESVIYENENGKKLRDNGKDIFISKKVKFTFSGYARSQLQRVKGHNKFVVKYPKTHIVFKELKDALNKGEIDYNWINDFFGGDVAKYVTELTQQEANKLPKVQTVSWNDFVQARNGDDDESMTVADWAKYTKPHLVDYVSAKDLRAHKFDLNKTSPQDAAPGEITTKSTTLREFLLTEASFRSISNTQYNIFTPPDDKYNGGIFNRDGNLKSVEPTYIGDFVCQLSIDEMNYKRDLEDIRKLWEWRTNRNEKRAVLEENLGYDVKHCSHLFRLLLGAHNILKTGEYKPRLSGDNLKLVMGVLNGKYSYDWIITESEKLDKELDKLYVTSTIPHTANRARANKLLLELSR